MNKLSVSVSCTLLLAFSTATAQDEAPSGEMLTEDTPWETVLGNEFVAPVDWTVTARGPAIIIEAPEGGSQIVLVDLEVDDADAAIVAAWAAYKEHDWSLKLSSELPDNDGWSKRQRYEYQTSPNEKRTVVAGAMFGGETWTVWIYDMADEVGGKRGAQVNLLLGSLMPKGHSRESFAGREANVLDQARIAALTKFVTDGMEATGVPGVGVGIIQNGEVVFADGLGKRVLGEPGKVDADTRFMVASNTKAMTTLLLAKLVEAGEFTWKTPVTDIYPSFKLGDEETTAQVLVEHLICACTGMPRKDMQLILEFDGITPEDSVTALGDIQPTSDFGELFQYSNSMASAAGYVAGHVMHPEHELGAAYDMAMQSEVFDPLGMSATTFDFDAALTTEFADSHGTNVDGETGLIDRNMNRAIIHVRPAGAAWSTVNDMLKYIAMELAEGALPDGESYIAQDVLLERRLPKVAISQDAHYGMGLMIDNTYGVEVVHHGGDVFGQHSDMMWLPEYGVGAVVLTNGDPGWLIRGGFRRKLLEVLFDGIAEADEALASGSQRYFETIAADRKQLVIPADSAVIEGLASHYSNEVLGDIVVHREGDTTVFDFGEWKSDVGTRNNPDGTISVVTVSPGLAGLDFVVASGEGGGLIMRDAQHEYVFEET